MPLQHLPASHCCCHNVTFQASSGLLRPPAPSASTKTRGTLLSPSFHRKGAATKARMGPGGGSPAAPRRDLAGLLVQAAGLPPQRPGCAGPWCGREHAGCADGTPCPPAPCPQHRAPRAMSPGEDGLGAARRGGAQQVQRLRCLRGKKKTSWRPLQRHAGSGEDLKRSLSGARACNVGFCYQTPRRGRDNSCVRV